MIYVLCNVVTGALLISEQPISTEGHPLQVKTFDMPMPDLTKVEWDCGGLNFKSKTQGRIITKLAYLRRFTGAERIAIRTVAKTQSELEDYLALLELAEEISPDDPDTVAAVTMLEAIGLLAAGRAAEILA